MNTPVLAMVVVLLFLLFFKVPVFASVLGASAVYFVLNPNDIVAFDDEEWGVLDELAQPLRICLPTTFGLFASGMGGYVAVDLSDCDNCKATLWFSNRQPRYDINFWDIVDEWIVLGMQG